MPLGRVDKGIESFSALDNPRASPISNYYCKGYKHVNNIDGNFRKNMMKVPLSKTISVKKALKNPT